MNKSKQFIALGLGILFIAGLVFYGNMSKNSNNTSKPTNTGVAIEKIKDHKKGNSEAKVALVEYSDFQCPACGVYYPIVKKLVDEYGDKIEFTYKNFPLRNIHKNADLAARAAEAAGMQGKFWEMHDMLFENQKDWSEKEAGSIFNNYAKKIGLNVDQFKKDIASEDVKAKVQNDFDGGVSSGVNYTPSFFVNGKKVNNPRSYDEFKNLIEISLGN